MSAPLSPMALQFMNKRWKGWNSELFQEGVPYKGGQEPALALKLSLTETQVEEHLQGLSLLLQVILKVSWFSWCFTLKHTEIYLGKLVQDLLQSTTKNRQQGQLSIIHLQGFLLSSLFC